MLARTSRRRFLKTTATAATAMTASSYQRVMGANDRISIAVIGLGVRGRDAHINGINVHAKAQNVEITAICDPWRQRREEAGALTKSMYGREARKFVSYRDVVTLDDVDAVMIASCDHQHTTHLEAVARAKKDVYCEKPLATDFDKLKRACEAVRDNNVVFQAGTQIRSLPSMAGCRELYKTGILGNVSRIQQHRNSNTPYWYSRIADVDKRDVDWEEFLMDAPKRPFDPVRYSGWYGYLDYSDGPVPGLGTHFLDLVHYITGASFPTSAVCLGGVFTWKDKHHFTCPDQVEALWTYPEGFMVSYSTNFGNSGANNVKFMGDQGTLDMPNWNTPVLNAEGGFKNKGVIRGETPVAEVPMPDHFLDWLQCLRTRETCNASLEAGYQQTVAALMAVRAFNTGRRQVYDVKKREIREG